MATDEYGNRTNHRETELSEVEAANDRSLAGINAHALGDFRPDPTDYFASLVQKAHSVGLLSESAVSMLQAQLASLLTALADKRTGGRSSSLPVEEGRRLLLSATYVIGLALKKYPSADEALSALLNVPLEKLHSDGMTEAARRLSNAKNMQKRIVRSLFKSPNKFWASTVSGGISGFFKLYSPTFDAREIHITADYPPLAGRPKLCGIEFIERYLRYIEAENSFLLLFSSADCDRLLKGLAKDYADSPVNLFEPVLLCALALAHFEKNPRSLELSAADIEKLDALLSGADLRRTAAFLTDSLDKLDSILKLPRHVGLYVVRCMPMLARTVFEGVRHGHINRVFLQMPEEAWRGEISIRDGERLGDSLFGRLREQLLAARSAGERLALITENVHSAADIADIVGDALIEDAEQDSLAAALPLPAFVLLLKRFPSAELEERPNERRFAAALQKRFESLPADQREKLAVILESMAEPLG